VGVVAGWVGVVAGWVGVVEGWAVVVVGSLVVERWVAGDGAVRGTVSGGGAKSRLAAVWSPPPQEAAVRAAIASTAAGVARATPG
jgi:hypothetical protein